MNNVVSQIYRSVLPSISYENNLILKLTICSLYSRGDRNVACARYLS